MFISDYLEKLLVKIDLLLVEADGELHIIQSKVDRYRNSIKRKAKEEFILWSLEEEKQLLLIKDLLKAREELLQNVRIILSRYDKKVVDVFFEYFVKKKTKEKVAQELNLSLEATNKIINDLELDLGYFYK